MRRGLLGSQFRWLWAAFAVSTVGTWLAFDAFPMVAILALHARPVEVSLLAAAGLAVSAVVAVVVGAADICFRAASGACLKALVAPEQLLTANARFESTTWTATMIGPPLGGALIGIFGPVATVIADAVSYVLSALGISVIAKSESRPVRTVSGRRHRGEVLEGWRYILEHPPLRALLANTVLVNGLVLATAPLIAVLMLAQLGIAPWEYGLAFAAPCLGGLVGARLAGRLTARYGQHTVLRYAGTLRACWSIGLAFIPSGWAGVALVGVVQLGLVTCMGVFNPVFATYRLEQTPADRLARTLAAWTITSKATVAALTALWGVLASVAGVRIAIALAGVIMLATPLLLPARTCLDVTDQEPEALAVA